MLLNACVWAQRILKLENLDFVFLILPFRELHSLWIISHALTKELRKVLIKKSSFHQRLAKDHPIIQLLNAINMSFIIPYFTVYFLEIAILNTFPPKSLMSHGRIPLKGFISPAYYRIVHFLTLHVSPNWWTRWTTNPPFPSIVFMIRWFCIWPAACHLPKQACKRVTSAGGDA